MKATHHIFVASKRLYYELDIRCLSHAKGGKRILHEMKLIYFGDYPQETKSGSSS